MPSRNRPQTRRKPSLETLEKRYLMSGAEGEFTGEQLELLQENYADYIGNILLREDQWNEESLTRLVDGSVGDTEFIGLGNLVSSMDDKRDLIRSLDTRSDLVAEDIRGIEAEVTRDTEGLGRQLEMITASSARIGELIVQVENDINEMNRLTDAIAALWEEDRVGDENIAMLEQNLPSYQARLEEVSADRAFLEPRVEDMMARMQKYERVIPLLEQLVERNPNNRAFQKLLMRVRVAYQAAADEYARLDEQLTLLKILQQDLQTTITNATDMLSALRVRDQAIPGEIAAAEEGRDAAAARKQEAEEEREEVAGILALAEEASDALEADLLRAAEMHEMDEALLTTIATDITREFEDLVEIRNVLRTTMEELLSEEEEPLADTDTVTQTITIVDGSLQEDRSWRIDLPGMGGTASFTAWPRSPVLTVEPISGSDLHRALVGAGITQEQIDAAPKLGNLLGLEEGFQAGNHSWEPYLRSKTVSHPALGTVTVQTHLWKPPDQREDWWALLLNQNGTLSGAGIVDGAPTDVGIGPFSMTFGEPRYVQWVEVKHLGGDNHGTLVVTRADGSTYSINLSSGSAKIAIDAPVRALRINPEYSYSYYGFGKMSTDAPENIPDIPEGEQWLKGNGFVTALDLKNAGKMVSDISLRVRADRPNVRVTAHAYRGDTLVATQDADADGMVHLVEEGGITSVILEKSDLSANLIVSPVATTGWKDLPQPAADGLSPATNGTIALLSYPSTVVEPANYPDKMVRAGITLGNAFNVHPTSGMRLFADLTDNGHYARHEVNSAGDVGIREVRYFTDDALYLVDPAYWRYVDGQYGRAIITYPGSPRLIVLGIGGNGSGSLSMNVARGERLVDVMPPQDMQLDVSVLYSRAEPADEGWTNVPAGVPSTNYHGGGGGEFSIFFRVKNLGLGGGPVTARVHVGQSGSADDPVVKEIAGELPALVSKGLWINTELRQTGDSVTLEILDSEGNVVGIYARKIHPPRVNVMTDEERQTAMGSRRIDTLNAKIVDAVLNSPSLEGWRGSIGSSSPTLATLEQSLKLTALAIEKDRIAFENRGTRTREELLEELWTKYGDVLDNVSWQTSLATVFTHDDWEASVGSTRRISTFRKEYYRSDFTLEGVNANSAMGQIFLGLVQRLLGHADYVFDHQNDPQVHQMVNDPLFSVYDAAARRVEELTGIDHFKILNAAQPNQSYETKEAARESLINGLRALFIEAQYGEIFTGTSAEGTAEVLSAHVDKPLESGVKYTDADAFIRVRFDYTTPNLQFDRVNVYLMDPVTGEQISLANTGRDTLMPDTHDQLYIDVPMENVRDVFPDGVFHGRLYFKIGLMYLHADTSGMPGLRETEQFELNLRGDLTFDPQEVLGEQAWNALSDADKETVRQSLNFGRVGNENSRALIEGLVNTFLSSSSIDTHKMTYNTVDNLWIGPAYEPVNEDDDTGQCKYWIQMQVVKEVLGITLPNNSQESNSYSWLPSEVVTAKASWEQGTIQEVIENQDAAIQAGDIIQMAASDNSPVQHTVIIGKVDSDGIWIFESNGLNDLTPRYRKKMFAALDEYDRYTIYRII